MDYFNHPCPVCEKVFEKNDEIVVCPLCGTPHHRDCYELENHCHFQDKHKDNFDYNAEFIKKDKKEKTNAANEQPNTAGFVACEACGTFNIAGNDKCSGCGAPLPEKGKSSYNPYDRHTQENTTPPQGNQQNNQPFGGGFAYDPMGGLKSETDVGKGVTVGEVAKFTKNNSPFYTRLFHQIKVFGRSRFSFVGFLFHGGWMLYRKMYKLGAIFTTIMALFIISQLYIVTFYGDLLTEITKLTSSVNIYTGTDSASVLKDFLSNLDKEDLIVTIIYFISSIGQFIVRIICGIFGNRWYYKHSIKHIQDIKQKAGSKEEADTTLQTKGGVNSALATSLLISYIILTFLPNFF